jgi:CheY-like chemotaxis protein
MESQREGGVKREDLSVLVVDDVKEVREAVEGYLTSGGFSADVAESAVDLLYKLRDNSYAVVLLDIELGSTSSCERVYDLCRKLFPHISFAHRKVLASLGFTEESPASGTYLLPMVKAIAPGTEVVMLSGTWREEDGPLLSQLGAYTIVPKDAPDSAFGDSPGAMLTPRHGIDSLQGLRAEIYWFLDKIRAAKSPAADEETR